MEATTGTDARTYILFTVAGTTYAAPSQEVRHVEMIENVTAVPNAPPFVDGVVFSRGQVVPVINLRARFGFERVPCDLRTRLLVVETKGRVVGLMVDDARAFLTIPDTAVQPPGSSIAGLNGDYLSGIATIGDRLVLVLDVHGVVDASPETPA